MEGVTGLSDSWYGWTMFNAVTNKIKQFFMFLNQIYLNFANGM